MLTMLMIRTVAGKEWFPGKVDRRIYLEWKFPEFKYPEGVIRSEAAFSVTKKSPF